VWVAGCLAYEKGSLDMLVQRSGDQKNERITFIQNNIFHDAFFLKALGKLSIIEYQSGDFSR
jgi:hypothetical protein